MDHSWFESEMEKHRDSAEFSCNRGHLQLSRVAALLYDDKFVEHNLYEIRGYRIVNK